MFQNLSCWLAQLGPEKGAADVVNGVEPPADPPGGSPFGIGFWLPMLLAMVLIMLMMRPRKTDTALKKRLAELKKNDRVVTAGGIIGTIVAFKDDNQSVTLRIDESTNTKMQVLKASIVRVLGDEKASSDGT